MKNSLIVILALIIGAAGGYFTWKYLIQKNGSSSSFKPRQVTLKNYKDPFMWGINVNPSPVRNYSLENWTRQMGYVTDLGAKWIRLVFDYNATDKFKIFDEMIDTAKKQNINTLLSLDSSKPVTSLDNAYDDGYKVGSDVATHYKGKVRYYQVLNEVGGTVIKGAQYSGESESDFDLEKYAKVRDWSKGAIAAIRKIDPDAYIVMDFHWTHYAIVDMLLRDGLDFDIIGWNWYADMKIMSNKKLADGTLLVDKIKSYNKPVILAEVNGSPAKGEAKQDAQANFLKEMADWAYGSGFIKGFFVHELVDAAPTTNREANYFGIISFKKGSDGGYTFGERKKAFYTYQELIAKYSR